MKTRNVKILIGYKIIVVMVMNDRKDIFKTMSKEQSFKTFEKNDKDERLRTNNKEGNSRIF